MDPQMQRDMDDVEEEREWVPLDTGEVYEKYTDFWTDPEYLTAWLFRTDAALTLSLRGNDTAHDG